VKKTVASLALLLLAACQPAKAVLPTAPVATEDAPVATATAAFPTPPATAIPNPTVEQLMYPYTIDGLRHHKFESGRIWIEKTLARTADYTSYLISYPSDGLTITGVMQIPVKGKPPFPVILMDHGYFNREEYKPGSGTDRAAEYLNQHGYLTLASDYRSWGGSDAGPSLYYSGLAIDVMNLLNAIPSIHEADLKRVGIWGHSMGGAVTIKVLTIDSRIKAGVLYSSVSADNADPIQRWGLGCIGDIMAGEHQLDCNSSDIIPLELPPELIKAYYETSLDATILNETSPIYHLDLVTAPIEINYGTEDGKISNGTPPDWSKKLYNALIAAGKDAHIYAYDGQLHSFVGDAWNAFMERTVRFFDQYVKNAK
jgi:dipeptidyl aminopeptidase/acylaminoacyl peptidase